MAAARALVITLYQVLYQERLVTQRYLSGSSVVQLLVATVVPGRTSAMSNRAYEGTHGQDSCQAVRSSRARKTVLNTFSLNRVRKGSTRLARQEECFCENWDHYRNNQAGQGRDACRHRHANPSLQPQHPQPTSPWYLMHIAYPTHAFRRSQQTLALHANIDFTSSSSHPTYQSPSPHPPIQTLSKYARSH